MSTFQLRTFGDLLNAIREEIQIQSTDTTALNRIRRDLNIVYQEVAGNKNWWWLEGKSTVQLPVYHGSGTAAVTVGSNAVTLTVAPLGVSRKGYKFAVEGFDEIYIIESHVAGSTDMKLDREYTGASSTAASYKIWTDKVALPTDCKETIRAWHDYHASPMDSMGMTEFRRAQGMSPRAEGRPLIYSTGDFIDVLQTSPIASMPALTSRASAGVIKSLIFASTIPSAITSSLQAGAPVRVRISGASNAAYNGDFLINSVSTTNVANDTLTYVAPIELQDAATADAGLAINILEQENTLSRYRELYVHPAVTNGRISIHVDYVKHVLDMSDDSDEPLVPMEDRIVLYYGALAKAWRRYRNKEESDTCYQLYRDKMSQMAGKLQDSLEKPRLVPSKMYLSTKRSSATGRRPDASFGAGTSGGGSSGAIVTGTPNTVTVFNSRGETEGSSVTTTELSALAGVRPNIQTQIDSKLSAATLDGLTARVGTAETDIDSLQAADVVLQANIDAEASARATAVSNEATARATAVSNEATTRAAADTTLQTNIDNEATARAAADTALGTRVTTLEGQTTDAIPEGSTNLYYTNARADARISAQKAAANGLATLGADSKIPNSQLPALAITDTYVAASQAAMLALSSAETGDVCVRTDLSKSFILRGTSYSTLSDWQELLTPPGGVSSVNGNTGAVTLTTTDITEGTRLYYTDARADARITPKFDTSTGHSHNGVDSKKILATNLDATGATTGQVLKWDGSNVTWGSGGGQGGINLLTLDTSWGATKTTNSDAETSVGDWTAYSDTAGISPIDMTGGTPNTTIARDTSSPLNGAAHFTMTVSSGATRQGEGVSCTANVPPAYRGKNVSFQFPFAITGTVVDGDFSLFAYDVTNSTIITPYAAGKILGASGTAIGTFPIPTTCTQLRVGIHVSRASNTGSVVIKFDDVKVTPDVPAMGMAGSDWTAYTPTFTNFGTPTNVSFQYRRVGDTMEIMGTFTPSAVNSSVARVSIPAGLSFDTTKLSTSGSIVGHTTDAVTVTSGNVNATYVFVANGQTSNLSFGGVGNGSTLNNLTEQSSTSIFSTSAPVSILARVPIAGWSSNISIGMSSTFRISSYLANGTRVTATPTALGQYRCRYRATTSSGTYTDAAPTTAPSATNGMQIYGNVPWNAGGTSGQITLWDIFVGKGLPNPIVQFYQTTGMTGAMDISFFNYGGNTDYGAIMGYDPVTGVLTIDAGYVTSGSVTARALAATIGNTGGSIASGYFDIIVSQNALAVGMQWQPPTVQRFTSGSGTYTLPSGVRYLKVKMAGGGGGGGGGAAGAGAPGGSGGNTTFGTSLLTCTGGSGGPSGGSGATGGAGGTATVNSPAITLIAASGGSGSGVTNGATVGYSGGMGGANALGGAGATNGGASNGVAGVANTGAGGGGGGGTSSGSFGGNGGGAGGYIEAMITNVAPGSTYAYSVGAGGSNGSSTSNGGAGGSGVIIVEEYYQ